MRSPNASPIFANARAESAVEGTKRCAAGAMLLGGTLGGGAKLGSLAGRGSAAAYGGMKTTSFADARMTARTRFVRLKMMSANTLKTTTAVTSPTRTPASVGE